MNDNIGKNIKILAQILGWGSLILCGFIWLIALSNYSDYPWIWLVIGTAGFISAWPMYAVGKIVDDINTIRNHLVSPEEEAVNDDLPPL